MCFRFLEKLLLLLLVIYSAHLAANRNDVNRPHVAYLASDHPGFWSMSLEVAQKVATDLNIQFTFIPIDNRFSSIEAINKLANSASKPDYVLFHYQEYSSAQMLDIAESSGIKSFVFNTDIPARERKRVGYPREKYKHWIAHMHPEDKYMGYLLAEKLIGIQHYVTGIRNNKIIMGAVSEWDAYLSAAQRVQGLKERVKEDPKVRLVPMIKKAQGSEQAVLNLLQRYPDISILWTSSDTLAQEAVSAAKLNNRIPGKDIFIGGTDATASGLQAVRDGDLAITLGGHFMESAWALVLIYDYHMGLDFMDELGTTINLPMLGITKSNINYYTVFFEEKSWMEYDFKQESKIYTPSLTNYNFSLEKFLQ